MTAEVVLDTDVASHLMRGSLLENLTSRIAGVRLAVTFVTVGELYRGAAHARWGQRRLAALANWLNPCPSYMVQSPSLAAGES